MNDWSLLSTVPLRWLDCCTILCVWSSIFFLCVCTVDWTNVEERLRFLRHFILRFFSPDSPHFPVFIFRKEFFLLQLGRKSKKSLFFVLFYYSVRPFPPTVASFYFYLQKICKRKNSDIAVAPTFPRCAHFWIVSNIHAIDAQKKKTYTQKKAL